MRVTDTASAGSTHRSSALSSMTRGFQKELHESLERLGRFDGRALVGPGCAPLASGVRSRRGTSSTDANGSPRPGSSAS